MIVTVDFSGGAVSTTGTATGPWTLTSAELKVTFKDGTTEKTTFNLTTEVSSPDNIKFTIPLLNPRVGTYALTVKAQDSAGNNRLDGRDGARSSGR